MEGADPRSARPRCLPFSDGSRADSYQETCQPPHRTVVRVSYCFNRSTSQKDGDPTLGRELEGWAKCRKENLRFAGILLIIKGNRLGKKLREGRLRKKTCLNYGTGGPNLVLNIVLFQQIIQPSPGKPRYPAGFHLVSAAVLEQIAEVPALDILSDVTKFGKLIA
jgi:hypothetical protein